MGNPNGMKMEISPQVCDFSMGEKVHEKSHWTLLLVSPFEWHLLGLPVARSCRTRIADWNRFGPQSRLTTQMDVHLSDWAPQPIRVRVSRVKPKPIPLGRTLEFGSKRLEPSRGNLKARTHTYTDPDRSSLTKLIND